MTCGFVQSVLLATAADPRLDLVFLTAHSAMTPELALAHLWRLARGDPGTLARATVTGQDTTLPSTFRLGTLAAATIAAAGLAAAECHRLRTRVAQPVAVSVRDPLVPFPRAPHLPGDAGPPPA